MLGKQFWLYKFLQLEVSGFSYSSNLFGLYGLESAKYRNHNIFDTKLTQKHQKITFLDLSTPLTFETALATFVGLLYFSCNPWCLIRPVVPRNEIFHQYFITKRKWMRFDISVHCALTEICFQQNWFTLVPQIQLFTVEQCLAIKTFGFTVYWRSSDRAKLHNVTAK